MLWNATMLAEWRRRWTDRDTYWSSGDVATDSPGDGSRIDSNASAFRSGATEPWQPPDRIENLDNDVATEGRDAGFNVRDCALRALITEDQADIDAVKAHMLAEIRQPWMDVSDATWWDGIAYTDRNPLFVISELWTRYVFAYGCLDYLGAWTGAEQSEWAGVMNACAQLAVDNANDSGYLAKFTDRQAGVLSGDNGDPGGSQHYVGGPYRTSIGAWLANRRVTMGGFVGLVAATWGDTGLIGHGKQMASDVLRFTFYRDGSFTDFPRETAGNADQGWNYTASALTAFGLAGLAFRFLRNDSSIINMVDNVGSTAATAVSAGPLSDGTSDDGADKSVRQFFRSYAKYVDANVYSRTGINSGALIGSARTTTGECQLAIGNVVWGDSYISDVLARTATGVSGWPTSDTAKFRGNGEQLPGYLFMFAGTGLEGVA